jgi:hypothetical protein
VLFGATADPAADEFYKNYALLSEASDADRPALVTAYAGVLGGVKMSNKLGKAAAAKVRPTRGVRV